MSCGRSVSHEEFSCSRAFASTRIYPLRPPLLFLPMLAVSCCFCFDFFLGRPFCSVFVRSTVCVSVCAPATLGRAPYLNINSGSSSSSNRRRKRMRCSSLEASLATQYHKKTNAKNRALTYNTLEMRWEQQKRTHKRKGAVTMRTHTFRHSCHCSMGI